MMNKMTEPAAPTFVDVYLKQFAANNPHCVTSVDGDHLLVEKPWGTDNVRLRSSTGDHEFIGDLNHLVFNPRFDAVYHSDKKQLEIFFTYLDPKQKDAQEYLDRQFSLHFDNHQFQCYFAEPTERLFRLAAAYEQLPSDTTERPALQLMAFKDAQRQDKLSERVRQFFIGKVPRSFFVTHDGNIEEINFELLARHINLLCHFYDRQAPLIIIREGTQASASQLTPIRFVEDRFPNALMMSPIDDIVMRLLEVARYSNPRSSFVYYYQIFEYAGYYYIDEKARKALHNALRDPALIACGEDKVAELFSIFTDLNHGDDVKMRRVIEDHCDPRITWKEVQNDLEFFCSEHHFDGGFVLPALIAKGCDSETWKTMWMPKTFDVLTKIRNALVHAREKRENRVILPTAKNNAALGRYIPLIQRMAEQLALRT